MIYDPDGFWRFLAKDNKPYATGYLFGKVLVFIRDSELSLKVFNNIHPDAFKLVGHPQGESMFGDNNLIMMHGEQHKQLRIIVLPLFTIKALGVYVSIQEETIRKHIKKWKREYSEELRKGNKYMEMRGLIRDMNLETSQNVFVGPYLTPESRRLLALNYSIFNKGFLSFPINVPGSNLYKGHKAIKEITKILGDCARQSKERMREGKEPSCLLDFWMEKTVVQIDKALELGQEMPKHSTDDEIGHHVFDFLFAAQDASTSSLVWALTLLEGHPDVLQKVIEEQEEIRGGERLTAELLRKMPYTEQVMREILRFRPPATLVPHMARKAFKLTDDFTIPEGAIVFPSVYESSFQGFTDPFKFDPSRFSSSRKEDSKYRKNWLVFGAGPHQCPGQRYAMNHIMCFISIISMAAKWKRKKGLGRDDLTYLPTIYPADGANLKW
eukprot:CAMPEP_0174256750 /NCGR_PEP_ID=MMETSP0439-20130205/5949_1 /TAXON_ID=0 /ORGANISM="Stereomyxa ramosa, Strain Chinc5" /LENGTH=439 /DNA_ID=CAMNT_0015339499 /DNA_START=281 /DNA_END=1597 /DNA_ORIENTATION=+